MKLALDRYAHLDSPIHRWEQRSKLVALLTLILAFALIEDLRLMPGMAIVTGILLGLSRLPLGFVLHRLRYPGLFITAVVIFLPFVAGETVLWQWQGLRLYQEGCVAVLAIATRFTCIMIVSLVLFGTAPFLTSIRALRALGLPPIVVDMMLLSYRYIEEFGQTLTTMQRAMRLRGFQVNRLNRRNLDCLAGLAGSLLIRSYERSQRVYEAMILRGYHSSSRGRQQVWLKPMRATDAIALAIIVSIAAGFVLAETIR
ncbi:MAG: cobalt ECF transporter T component CbiQ [Jaaginema sp. PMC 1079.18]|nr:cobalt ECF transporter T component CbiQ [Jaaginema sp. PMC 1080.18]MEC4850350.1 cobalt ECF transporter T component CbiQ [Jaaginema sp. PMC 1079.18]MEC4867148.1 cobalt ECF transporter T component CbiQ [Jaaginema sp. PMC 1078.18]